jgi:basic membrane protein A
MDNNNASLVSADMVSALESAKSKIISGSLKVHDYMADNACPAK